MPDRSETIAEPRERVFPAIFAYQYDEDWVVVQISTSGPFYMMTEADADALYHALGRTHRSHQDPRT